MTRHTNRYRRQKTMHIFSNRRESAAILERISTLAVVFLFAAQCASGAEGPSFHEVACEGHYPGHLQGVAVDASGAIYWSFTTELVKTDNAGRVIKKVEVPDHHGDLTVADEKVFVAVNLGQFNQPAGKADSWVYVYSAEDLALIAMHAAPQVVHGAGGIAFDGRRFLVVGGLPIGYAENYLYEFDRDLKFVARHILDSGYTLLGIQTAEYAAGRWWFGCYGDPKQLLVADDQLALKANVTFEASLGVVHIGDATDGTPQFLVARGQRRSDGRHTAQLKLARPDAESGLKLMPAAND